MEKQSKEILILLALELDLKSLLKFCQTNKKINKIICDNDIFWKNKIEKERPEFLSKIYEHLNFKTYKDLYKKLLGENVYELTFPDNDGFYIKGDFDEFDFKENIELEKVGLFWSDNKTTIHNWELTNDLPEYLFELPAYTNTRKDLIDLVETEVSVLMDANGGSPEYYLKKLDETGTMNFNEEGGEFNLYINEIDIY